MRANGASQIIIRKVDFGHVAALTRDALPMPVLYRKEHEYVTNLQKDLEREQSNAPGMVLLAATHLNASNPTHASCPVDQN